MVQSLLCVIEGAGPEGSRRCACVPCAWSQKCGRSKFEIHEARVSWWKILPVTRDMRCKWRIQLSSVPNLNRSPLLGIYSIMHWSQLETHCTFFSFLLGITLNEFDENSCVLCKNQQQYCRESSTSVYEVMCFLHPSLVECKFAYLMHLILTKACKTVPEAAQHPQKQVCLWQSSHIFSSISQCMNHKNNLITIMWHNKTQWLKHVSLLFVS